MSLVRPVATERKCAPPSAVTRSAPPLPTAEPNCRASLAKPIELSVEFAGAGPCAQVAPLSAERQMSLFAPTATARGPEMERPLSAAGGWVSAVQLAPPSEVAMATSPTAIPWSASSANRTGRSVALVDAEMRVQLAPPSDERSTTPPSPTAQARERSEAKATERSADETGEPTAAQLDPPSAVRRSVPPSPTARPALASAKTTARSEESVGVLCSDQCAPPSRVAMMVPESPAAQPSSCPKQTRLCRSWVVGEARGCTDCPSGIAAINPPRPTIQPGGGGPPPSPPPPPPVPPPHETRMMKERTLSSALLPIASRIVLTPSTGNARCAAGSGRVSNRRAKVRSLGEAGTQPRGSEPAGTQWPDQHTFVRHDGILRRSTRETAWPASW